MFLLVIIVLFPLVIAYACIVCYRDINNIYSYRLVASERSNGEKVYAVESRKMLRWKICWSWDTSLDEASKAYHSYTEDKTLQKNKKTLR